MTNTNMTNNNNYICNFCSENDIMHNHVLFSCDEKCKENTNNSKNLIRSLQYSDPSYKQLLQIISPIDVICIDKSVDYNKLYIHIVRKNIFCEFTMNDDITLEYIINFLYELLNINSNIENNLSFTFELKFVYGYNDDELDYNNLKYISMDKLPLAQGTISSI